MKFFNFAWNRETSIRQYIRRKLRTIFNIKWLKLCTHAIGEFYAEFSDQVKAWRRRLVYTSQVIWLEKLLNDLFDNALRRIHIEDGEFVPVNNIWLQIEEQEPVTIYLQSEGEDPFYIYGTQDQEGADFIVYIPIGVYSAQEIQQMMEELNAHKLAGKTYIIIEE